jgi:hypothetical protein
MVGFNPIWDTIRSMPYEERIKTEKKIFSGMFGIDVDDMFKPLSNSIPDSEVPFDCRRNASLYSIKELTDLLKKGVYEI